MIKKFCDCCGHEMDKRNTPCDGKLISIIHGGDRKTVISVEITHATNGVMNKGDLCKYCIIDAIYALDDRGV